MQNKIIFVIVLTIFFVGATFFAFNSAEEISVAENQPVEPATKIVTVFVSGQVKNPAVVKLEDSGDLRKVDAVNAAGGLTDFADTEVVNLAEPIFDGAHIHIPTKEIFFQETSENLQAESESTLININTADETELQKLRRVGPAIAKRIIEYREQNGRFQTIEDIKKVRGIGEKTFQGFRDKITVN